MSVVDNSVILGVHILERYLTHLGELFKVFPEKLMCHKFLNIYKLYNMMAKFSKKYIF